MLAEGLSYPKAIELIQALGDKGIEANIAVGAVRLNPSPDKIAQATKICEAFGAAAIVEGNTSTMAAMHQQGWAEKQAQKEITMNKNQAEAWVRELTELLTGRDLITLASGGGFRRPEIRQSQTFNKAYYVEHSDGGCVVALSDSYGTMTGAEKWSIDPNLRTVYAETTNSYGEPLVYAWTIVDDNYAGGTWTLLNDAQKRLRAIK